MSSPTSQPVVAPLVRGAALPMSADEIHPSGEAWARADNSNLKVNVNAGFWDRSGQGSVKEEEEEEERPRLAECEALAAVSLRNLDMRQLDSAGFKTRAELADLSSDLPAKNRVLEPVGLRRDDQEETIRYAHVIDHQALSSEPLVLFNQKMEELPPRAISIPQGDWKEVTDGIGNIVSLSPIDRKDLKSRQAAIVSTKGALLAHIAALEAKYAMIMLLPRDGDGNSDGEKAPFIANPGNWVFEPNMVLQGGRAACPPVEYRATRGEAQVQEMAVVVSL